MRRYRRYVRWTLVSLLPLACGERAADTSAAGGPEEAGGIAVYCTTNLPQTLSPFISPDLAAADLRPLLYTPVALYDSVGGVQPYLARRWEWEDGQRLLRLHLRTDVTWHDGVPLTAEDVVWTLRAAADSTFPYWRRLDFASMSDLRADGPDVVEIRFSEPFVAGLEPLIALPILPRHLLADLEGERFRVAEYHRQPVGSGPFRFAGRSADGGVILERYGAFPEELGRARLDRLVLRELATGAAALVELRTGGADACVIATAGTSDVAAVPTLRSVALEPNRVLVMPLDTRKPPFHDARVRRAVSAALDRAAIAATSSGVSRPAGTFLPAGADRWRDSTLLQPDADTTLAAALLDSAGWSTVGPDGIRRNAGGEPLRFTMVAPTTFERVLTIIQSQLRRVGMDPQIRLLDGSSYAGLLQNPDSRPTFMVLAFIPDQILLPVPTELHSRGAANLASYANASVDSLVDELGTVIPDARRAEIYRELQRRVAEDVPIIYATYSPRLLAIGPRLQGVVVDLNGPFANANEWWIPAAQRRTGGGS